MFDLETLRLIWWVLVGVLFIGFAIMDGYDLGAAILFPLVTRNETERLIVLQTLGPFWEGNQVWIVLGAGAMFAAWPIVYAVAFSGPYFVVLLLLLTMGISRPVSFKYRTKLPNLFWRRCWDWIVFIGGLFPALLFGMLVGNILQGLPFAFDTNLRMTYEGTFVDLINPFALWCGLTGMVMLVMHGGIYLAVKTYDPIRARAIHWARLAALGVILLFIGGGIWVAYFLPGYQLPIPVDPAGFSNPLHKQVIAVVGGWLANYQHYPFTMVLPIIGVLSALGVVFTAKQGNSRLAILLSSLSIIGIIGTVGVSMFPFILPSSHHLPSSLLIWDASSSAPTLLLMLVSVIIFLPMILLYTAWVRYVLRGKVDKETVDKQAY